MGLALDGQYAKAVASLRRDETELLAFFDFPAEHWLQPGECGELGHRAANRPIHSAVTSNRIRSQAILCVHRVSSVLLRRDESRYSRPPRASARSHTQETAWT